MPWSARRPAGPPAEHAARRSLASSCPSCLAAFPPAAARLMPPASAPRFLLVQWQLAYPDRGCAASSDATLQYGRVSARGSKTTNFRQHHDAATGRGAQRRWETGPCELHVLIALGIGSALVLGARRSRSSRRRRPRRPRSPPDYGPPITNEQAKAVAAAALAEAKKNNWRMAFAIVGPAGELVYFEKMDGTQTGVGRDLPGQGAHLRDVPSPEQGIRGSIRRRQYRLHDLSGKAGRIRGRRSDRRRTARSSARSARAAAPASRTAWPRAAGASAAK